MRGAGDQVDPSQELRGRISVHADGRILAKAVGRGFSALALALLLMLSCLAFLAHAQSVPAYADEDSGKSREIAIAYDNSGSMIIRSDKWCGAKYSLEVIAAMLDENDNLAIYTMESTGQKLALSGSTPVADRVAAIHNADFDCSDWTEARTAQEAYEHLAASSADEKYLVIATDGEFDASGGLPAVKQTVESCKAAGITVIYLAIGSDADTIDSDEGANVFVYLAPSDEILETMTVAANKIFGRDALPAKALDTGSGTLTLGVPMSQIIVFAQGANVSVGDLQSADGETIASRQANVKYSEIPTANQKYPNFTVNDKLQGVVATYVQDMPSGEYSLDISGADSVEVYYKPYVDISLGLADDNGIEYNLQPGADNEMSAGTYDVEFKFLDPFTGEVLDSDLLTPAIFSLKTESNGTVQNIAEGDQFTVSTGTVTLVAHAVTAGGAQASQTYRGINVSPALKALKVNASSLSATLEMDAFADASYDVKVSKDDGSALSAEEWAALQVAVDDPSGIVWAAEKSSEPGVVTLKPQLVEGDQWKTQEQIFGVAGVNSKTVDLTVTAEVEGADNVYRGSVHEDFTYGPNLMNTLMHALPFLVGLLVILYFIFKYITKPRLPRKMRPKLEFGDEEVELKYNEAKIQNKYSPWGPERLAFTITPRSNASDWAFPSRFGWSSLELVATKKEKGRRRFKLSDETIRRMHSYQEKHGNFPEPEFSPLPRIPNKKEKNVRTFGASSSISFTGLGNENPRTHTRPSQEYRLKFK